MARIGIFGGTFDPIHNGHIAICFALKEAHGLDHVLFLPTHINPLKDSAPQECRHRLHMIKLALQGVPDCSAVSAEIDRAPPSYMIDTLHELYRAHELHPKDSLFLLMGDDQVAQFGSWKEPQELVALAQPLIARRTQEPLLFPRNATLRAALKRGLTPTPLLEISATAIRQRLKEGLYCGHLVDKKVLSYITRYKLYQ